ncbi:MAG: uroporphyrinogen-III synthase [Campylobacteraceae bacterium]|nr:uroporphyrinogen-III synthase [Campylobacteraceae bacterium]
MIYLISHTPNDRVKHIRVCEIKFNKFSVDLSEFEALVVTSKNSIKALKENSISLANLEVFSIGEGTTKEASEFGFSQIYTAKNAHGTEFAYEIAPLLKGRKALFLKAKETVSDVGGILEKSGVNLTQITAYQNSFLKLDLSLKPENESVLIFTSPSNVKGFLKNFDIDKSYKLIAIGNATAKELANYPNLIVSNKQTIDECINLALNL